ncbi:MAG TPA: hypothetical protein VLG38_02260 [Gammaproteobacteria bacterium]|nr:hypothetical protein [Gammaproteobacteria bacterium]
MEAIKKICRNMAANPNPHILTFSQLGNAAARGAILGNKVNNALAGAVLSIALKAAESAVKTTEDLIKEIVHAADTKKVIHEDEADKSAVITSRKSLRA